MIHWIREKYRQRVSVDQIKDTVIERRIQETLVARRCFLVRITEFCDKVIFILLGSLGGLLRAAAWRFDSK